jgi:hypothetical protein
MKKKWKKCVCVGGYKDNNGNDDCDDFMCSSTLKISVLK